MKSRVSLYVCRRNLYVFTACLLSFLLITMPFIQITVASSGAERQVLAVGNDRSDTRSTSATVRHVSLNAPVPSAAPEPFMLPAITATKTDALIGDDGDNKADPAGTEKIEYTVTISNTGTTDATGVTFQDPIDAHTTLVNGSVNTQPIADPDTYSASGNIPISLAAPGVLTNDRDPDTGNNSGLTVTKVQGVGANVGVATDTTATGRGGVKGSLTLNSNGSFTYEPPPGFTGGPDTFTYETSDGTKTDTATVTINISGLVWFISNNAGGLNRGTFSHPFTTIASFNTANAGTGAVPDPKNGDLISLRTGTGTYTEADGINLRQQQILIGNAVQFNTVFTAAADSSSAYTTFAGAVGAAPSIVTTAGNGVDLSTTNTIRGFNVGNTPGFFKINGGAVGSPIINTVNLTGTGGALNVSTSGAFGAAVSFGTFESTSSPAANLNLVGVTGTLGIASAGTGLSGSAAASAAVNVNGGSVSFTYLGNVSKSNAGSLVSISGGHAGGTITFQTGTLSATSGDGLQFNNADGTYNFNGTNTLNGGDAGIDILNGSGGTFTFSASSTITSPTGTAFNVGTTPGSPNVTYSGTITHNTAGQRAVNIDGTTGGAISIATVTAGSTAGGVGNTGVNINNASGSVTFTNLNLGTSGTRMTAQAVTIAGGSGAKNLGTVNIFTTGSAEGIHSTTSTGAISSTSGTIDTAGAAAANIVGTSAASRTPLNIQLTKVNTTGGSNGIVLTSTSQTGSPGGFNILGTSAGNCGGVANPGSASGTAPDTADCTGGQIQTTTGATGGNPGIGILLTDVDKVSLTRVRVNGHSNFGLKGTNVVGFTLTSSYFHNNGDDVGGDGEGCVYFYGLTGTTGQNSITNSFLDLGAARNLHVLNTSGTLDRLTVSGTTIGNDGTSGADGIFIQADNSANTAVAVTLRATVQNGRFNGSRGDGIQMSVRGTSTTDFVFTGNRMTNNHPNQVSGSTAVTLSSGGSAGSYNPNNTFNISNNIINNNSANNASGPAISVGKGGISADASFVGTISGNTIGTAGVANSGSAQGSGIVVDIVGGGVMNATITNNTIRQFTNFGILAQSGNVTAGGGTGNLIVDIRGNNIAEPSPASVTALFPTSGIRLVTGTNGGDNSNNCATIGGTLAADKNTVTGTGTNGASDLRVFQRFVTILAVIGYAGANNDNAAMQTFLTARNNLTTITATNNTATPGPGYSGTCTAPTSAPVVSEQLAQLNTGQQAASTDAMTGAPTQTVASTTAANVRSSLWTRAVTAFVNVAGGVLSLIEPTAHASSNSVAIASAAAPAEQKSAVRTTDNTSRRKVVSNHAVRSSRPLAPIVAGETVNITIGTLRPGDSVTITFQVTVNNPPNLTLLNPPRVRNQGTVSGTNFANVLTDDTAVGNAADPTDTPVDLFDTTTTLVSDLNPSNFGDQVTFTATINETPTQASVNPAGTVDFIDTSNGNAVICNDVAVTAGSAQCQTSSLTAGTHNIRADYSGDGNFDPSQSNIVAQVVNACTPNPVVTSTADSGAGTLREALANVCSGTTITFNIAGAGPHTITLTTGVLPVAQNVTIKNNSGESITVSGNNASRVFNINSGKTASIIGLAITGGSATDGGAIVNDGALTIVNSTLSGNAATADGGAISTTATGTSLTLINTTLSGNTAAGSGGGLIVLGGTASIINSTITNNKADSDNNSLGNGGGIRVQAGTVTLKNTIVAGNFNEDGASDAADDISGTVDAASSFNLIGTGGAGGLTNGVNNNQVGVANAGLGPLANNGGTTQTHALLSMSPAVETGSNGNLPVDTFDLDGDANTAETLPVDQRGTGFPRTADSADANTTQTVDIGAFELHPSIEDIGNQTTAEDTPKLVTFNLGDDTGALISTVTATSSNTALVTSDGAHLSFSGSGGSRTLTITPNNNANSPADGGTTTITVTVTATNGRTAVDTFDLTVTEVNDNPDAVNDTLTAVNENSGTRIIPFADLLVNDTKGPANENGQTITVTNVSNPVGGTVLINGTNVEFTVATNFSGTASFDYTITDNGTTNGVSDPKTDTATASFQVNSVNDPPVNTVPGPQSTNQDTPLVFSSGNGNQISVADPDAGTNSIQVTLAASNGTLTLSTIAGLSFTVGDGTADATMTFTGTITNINTALNGLTFTPTLGFNGSASLTITTNDLGNTGSGGALSDTDVVTIQVATNISIQNAKVVEPPSGSVNMIFTVALSAPAPASGVSVNFTTANDPSPAPDNAATAGQDYNTTSGPPVTFAQGEQLKTILVPVLADGDNTESNERFLVVLSSPVNGTITSGTAIGTILIADQPGTIQISELRTSGPAGAGDDFVEIYNPDPNLAHTVNDGSGIMDAAHGYGLFKMGAGCSATPVLIGVIPNGTVIPARGHYLFVGSTYSLGAYASGNQTLSADIESDRNVAIFSRASLAGISTATRLDAVGFGSNTGGNCDLLREGTTLTPLSGSVLEHSYFRDECGKKGNPTTFGVMCPSGFLVVDTNVNSNDFIFADTSAAITVAGQRLGAPGPQNLGSPVLRNSTIFTLLIDANPSIGANAPPNRVRDLTPAPPNAVNGTLSVRRRFFNNTGGPVTRLRFRIIDISAVPGPGAIADVRALTSGSVVVNGVTDPLTCMASNGVATTPCSVTILGTTLEQPPNQPLNGALNSSLGAGTVTLGTPLANGASINLQFLLGVQQTGAFKFTVNIEALP